MHDLLIASLTATPPRQGKGVKIAKKEKCKERRQNSQPCEFARKGIWNECVSYSIL